MENQTTVFYHDRVYAFSLNGVSPTQHGWRAKDFAEEKPHIWAGMLRITSSTINDDNFVVLEHDDRDGKSGVFASCLATHENVEQVIDSSRFYVIKLSDGKGNHAFLGIGFQDKQPAFDFKSELASLGNKARAREALSSGPKQDFSLQKGEKITVTLKGVTNRRAGAGKASTSSTATSSTAAGGADFSAFAIAPPTQGSRKAAIGASAAAAAAPRESPAPSPSMQGAFEFPSISAPPAPAPAAAAPAAAAPAAAVPAAEFDIFAAAAEPARPAPAQADPLAAFNEATRKPAAAAPAKSSAAAGAGKKKDDPFDFGNEWAF